MLEKFRKNLPFLALNLQAGEYLENFFVSAIFSIVSIRVFLLFTGYPQFGGDTLHIAHMLWGGLLMMASLVILLSFLSKQSRILGSIVGGLGFGAFIDELGKLVTKDNDYFFRPTFALIYLLFVLLFFLIRIAGRFIKAVDKDYKLNTLEVIKEVVIYDLDRVEKEKGLRYLERVNNKDNSVRLMSQLLNEAEVIGGRKTTLITKLKILLNLIYTKFSRRKFFASIISRVFIIGAIAVLVLSLKDIKSFNNFWDWGLFLSSLVSTILVLIGVFLHRTKKYLQAYFMYRAAVVVAIFLTQFFQFYRHQLLALSILVLNILALSALQFLIAQEKAIKKLRVNNSQVLKRKSGH